MKESKNFIIHLELGLICLIMICGFAYTFDKLNRMSNGDDRHFDATMDILYDTRKVRNAQTT